MATAALPIAPIGLLNVAMTNFAKAYKNNELIADMIAPRVPVVVQSSQYIVHGKESLQLLNQGPVAPGADPQQIRISYSAVPYSIQRYARTAPIPVQQQAKANEVGFDALQSATATAQNQVLLEREQNLANLLRNAANWPTANVDVLSGTSMWDNAASNPIQQVKDAKLQVLKSGVRANACFLPPDVIAALQVNPAITDRFKYVAGGDITLAQISQALSIPCYEAAGTYVDQAGNSYWVWGNDVVLGYVQPAATQQDLSFAKTFVWTGAPGSLDGYGVMQYPDPNLARKQDIVAADMWYAMAVTAPETGVLIKNAVNLI